MLKSTALLCLVVCQIALATNGKLNEKLEESFLPYDRTNSESDSKSQTQINRAIQAMLNKDILPIANKIEYIPIGEEKNLSKEQDHRLVILDIISDADNKSIKKRAINPKYRAASMAFFGAILNNRIARRGKRSVDGFYKPSLRLLSASYEKYNAPQPQRYNQAPEMIPQAAPQPQRYNQAPEMIPQAAPQPQRYNQAPEMIPQAAPQSVERIENTCSIGFSEPIHAGQAIVETYCRCPSGTYGIDCTENFVNPCRVNGGQYHPADASVGNRYFIECNWNTPYLFKCPSTLVWNQEIETCDWEHSSYEYSSAEVSGYY